jgi:hypothetical protein
MSVRFRALALTAFGLLTLTMACSAESGDEEADETEGALSESVCKGRAQQAKDKAYNECANGSFDYGACTKPANDARDAAVTAFNNATAAAKQRAEAAGAAWTRIGKSCADAVRATACEKILEDDEYEAAKFRAGRGNQARCTAEKNAQAADCVERALADSNEDSATDFKNDPQYKAAKDNKSSKTWAARRAWVSCGLQKAADATHDSLWCGNRANNAYNSAFSACRRECPNESHAACTPKEYLDKGLRNVDCGSQELQKGWFGSTCESSYKCERTDVCEKYDDQAELISDKKITCPAGKAPKLTITKEQRGRVSVAKDVTFDCVTTDTR